MSHYPGPLFELAAKREGVARVEISNREFVQRMRAEARAIAATKGWVTASDLRERAEELWLRPTSRNAWGAIFARGQWVRVGEEPSRTKGCHGHRNPRWTIRTEAEG